MGGDYSSFAFVGAFPCKPVLGHHVLGGKTLPTQMLKIWIAPNIKVPFGTPKCQVP